MSRALCVSLTSLGVASLVAGCATPPGQAASGYAGEGAHAIYRTGSDVYAGVGTAAKRPFQDLNMMQDPIPIVLLRAELNPYSVKGLISCDVLTNRVAELDLALGPDLDSPQDRPKSKVTEDAGLAAAAALEAAAAAAEGFMPVRSVLKRVSGATAYEKHVKHAILAGMDRRAFLKAIGVVHGCSWPAAPLTVPAEQAKVVAIWAPTPAAVQVAAVVQASGSATQLSSAVSAGPAAAPGQAVGGARTAWAPTAPVVQTAPFVQTATVAQPLSGGRGGQGVAATASAPQRPVQTATAVAAPAVAAIGAPTPATPRAAAPPSAQPVALVSAAPTTSALSPPASSTFAPAAPYPASAPWSSPPPGSR